MSASIFRRDGHRIVVKNAEGVDIVIGYTIEQHEAALNTREAAVRSDLERAHSAETRILRLECAAIQRDKADLEQSYAEKVRDLDSFRDELKQLSNQMPHDLLEEALTEIDQGRLDAAAQLLDFAQGRIDERSSKNELEREEIDSAEARVEYLSGRVAEAEVRWADAARHFERSARLRPSYDALYKASEFAWRMDQWDLAESLCSQRLTLVRKNGSRIQIAETLNDIGVLSVNKQRPDEAELKIREALSVFSGATNEPHQYHGIFLNNLAMAVGAQGRYALAERYCREALAVDATTVGESHAQYSGHLMSLAHWVGAQARASEAEELLREALSIIGASLGESHPSYALCQSSLALVLQQRGGSPEAEKLLRQALEVRRAVFGDEHTDVANSLYNYARLLVTIGKPDKAAKLFRESLMICEKILGPDHHHTKLVRRSHVALFVNRPDD